MQIFSRWNSQQIQGSPLCSWWNAHLPRPEPRGQEEQDHQGSWWLGKREGPKLKGWQKVGWIFLLLLIVMLRMAQIKHNPPDFQCWFNESSKICFNATPDMYAGESFRLLANEGASPISVTTQTLPTIRASIRDSEGDKTLLLRAVLIFKYLLTLQTTLQTNKTL